MSCQTQIDVLNTDSAVTCPDWPARQLSARPLVLLQVISLLSEAIAEANETGDKTILKSLKPVLTRAIGQYTGFGAANGRRSSKPGDDAAAIRQAIANAEKRLDLARMTGQYGSDSSWRVEYQQKKSGAVYMGLRHRQTRQYLYIGTVVSAKKK